MTFRNPFSRADRGRRILSSPLRRPLPPILLRTWGQNHRIAVHISPSWIAILKVEGLRR